MSKLHCMLGISLLAVFTQASALDFGGLLNKEQLGNIGKAVSQDSAPAENEAAPAPKPAADLSMFSNRDQIGSLKQALTQGAETAVKNLAKENGYLLIRHQ